MKNRIATFTLISWAALATVVSAQTQDQSAPQPAPAPQAAPMPAQAHRPADPQKQLNHLTKKLALTADQQNQILPILTDRDQQMSGIQGDNSLSPKERRSKVMALRSDSDSRLRNVLTDQQRAAYDQMQQDARNRAKTRKMTSTAAN